MVCQVFLLVSDAWPLLIGGDKNMRIDDITQASLLYDFYGQLLSKRQREVMELYHEENLTLSEIAEEFGISRQGVHDALKNAEKALNDYEEKLGLVVRFRQSQTAVQEIDTIMDNVMEKLQVNAFAENAKINALSGQVVEDLKKVKDIIDKLEE